MESLLDRKEMPPRPPRFSLEDFFRYDHTSTGTVHPVIAFCDVDPESPRVSWIVRRGETESGIKRIASSWGHELIVLCNYHDRDNPQLFVKENGRWKLKEWPKVG